MQQVARRVAKKQCESCKRYYPADLEHFFFFPFSPDKLTSKCIDCTNRYQESNIPGLEDMVYKFLSEGDRLVRGDKNITDYFHKAIPTLQRGCAVDFKNRGWTGQVLSEKATGNIIALGIRNFLKVARNSQANIDGVVAGMMRAALRVKFSGGKANRNALAWEKWTGYTVDQLAERLLSRFTAGMTVDDFKAGRIHIDHIRPKASFCYNSTSNKEFKECWALENLQPLWAMDNIRKGSLWEGQRVRRLRFQK